MSHSDGSHCWANKISQQLPHPTNEDFPVETLFMAARYKQSRCMLAYYYVLTGGGGGGGFRTKTAHGAKCCLDVGNIQLNIQYLAGDMIEKGSILGSLGPRFKQATPPSGLGLDGWVDCNFEVLLLLQQHLFHPPSTRSNMRKHHIL